MQVTEVKVRLVEDRTERLKAFCTIPIDHEFVLRDIKIIDGAKGLFVAMPSRKVSDHCPKCNGKNHLRARYCNDCGAQLPGKRTPDLSEGSSKLHVDVAHPINSSCRKSLQKVILSAYEKETKRSTSPGYMPRSLDVYESESQPPPPAATPPEEKQPLEPPPSQEEDKPFGAGLI